MQSSTSSRQKRIVQKLSFDATTAKRVTFEAWEFALAGPYQVEVTNASYGFEKADHVYVVGVDDHTGVPVPSECDCPADRYNDDDCKHKIVLATVGGPTVLDTATDASPPALSERDTNLTTAADIRKADGVNTALEAEPNACQNGADHCEGPTDAGLPCFDCYAGDNQ